MQEQNEKVKKTAEVFEQMHEGVNLSIHGMVSIMDFYYHLQNLNILLFPFS